MNIDAKMVESVLGREVGEIHVMIAKHELQGIRVDGIAEIFASKESEIQAIIDDPIYEDVKRVVAMQLAKMSADTDISWDSLEHKSLEKLAKAMEVSFDPEFHLKVAALANKAVRRHRQQNEPLNPATAGTRVNLTLTTRIIEKLNGNNGGVLVQERRVDVREAANHRITADEVKGFLEPDMSKSAPLTLEKELEKQLKIA